MSEESEWVAVGRVLDRLFGCLGVALWYLFLLVAALVILSLVCS